jgi:hypothetical protein
MQPPRAAETSATSESERDDTRDENMVPETLEFAGDVANFSGCATIHSRVTAPKRGAAKLVCMTQRGGLTLRGNTKNSQNAQTGLMLVEGGSRKRK